MASTVWFACLRGETNFRREVDEALPEGLDASEPLTTEPRTRGAPPASSAPNLRSPGSETLRSTRSARSSPRTVRAWVVVQDRRGGVAWATLAVLYR